MADKKRLEILVGDDCFVKELNIHFFQECIWPKLIERLPEHDISLHLETLPEAVVREGLTGKYDVVVSDCHYTEDELSEGFGVIDALSCMNPRPLLILCTSNDGKELQALQERMQGKADYVTGSDQRHKFEYLVDVLVEVYKNRE